MFEVESRVIFDGPDSPQSSVEQLLPVSEGWDPYHLTLLKRQRAYSILKLVLALGQIGNIIPIINLLTGSLLQARPATSVLLALDDSTTLALLFCSPQLFEFYS